MRLRAVLFAVAIVAPVVGCTAIFGLDELTLRDDFDGGGSGDAASAGSGGGGGAAGSVVLDRCGAGECYPAAPPPFSGPISDFTVPATGTVTCPAGKAPLPGAVVAGFQAAPPKCTCGPSAATVDCSYVVNFYAVADCSGGENAVSFHMGDCHATQRAYKIVGGGTPAGSCARSTGTLAAPAVSWATSYEECQLRPENGSCPAGSSCFEHGARACVYADGEQSCPSGYPVKESRFLFTGTELNDNRTCTCVATYNGTCGTTDVTWYTDPACTAGSTKGTGNDCFMPPTQVRGMRVGTFSADGGCTTRPTIDGGVQPNHPMTFCCTR